MTQQWLNGTDKHVDPSMFKGQVLMSSALTRDTRSIQEDGTTLFNYSTPTLTLGGSKDGLMRVTRLAESYWHQITNINSSQDNLFPVNILEGVSSYQFAGGVPPSSIQSNDLRSDVADSDAQSLVAKHMTDFIDQTLSNTVVSADVATTELVTPFLEAMY